MQRLLSQGHFSLTKTQEQILIEFNRVSDSITAFQMETGVYNKNLATTRADVLAAYQEYCEEIGGEARKASQLTQGMHRLAPKVKDGWIYKPKKERAWLGFGLKNREQAIIEQMEQMEQQNNSSNNLTNPKYREIESAVPTVPSVPNDKVLHFNRITPNERHICDICKGLEAVFQQDKNYFCKGCFDDGRVKAEASGVSFSEDVASYEGEVS